MKPRIFCSLACNREYHEVVVLSYPGDGNETHCQNCGAALDQEEA